MDPADSIILGDCISGMAAMPASCVDLVVTDPPFAIRFGAKRANYNRRADNVLVGYREVEREDYAAFSRAWIGAAHRVLKDSGSMFVFSGWNHLKDVLAALDGAGFETVNHIVWKYQFGVATKKKFVTSHYHCIYVCKDGSQRRFYAGSRFGPGKERYADMEDVWVIKREYWRGEKKTPTKLPSELVRKMLQYASQKGDLVMDPFMGSGQVAVVAKEMDRRYCGFEAVKEYFDFARARLEGAAPGPALPPLGGRKATNTERGAGAP